jgi:hypothetical protein
MSNPYLALRAKLDLCPRNSTGEMSFLFLLLSAAAEGYDQSPWTQVGPAREVLSRLAVYGRSHAFQRLEALLAEFVEREGR